MQRERIKKNKWRQLHLYYTYTGFYKFIFEGIKSAFWPTLLILGALFYVHYYVIDINEALIMLTERYSDFAIFSVFFIFSKKNQQLSCVRCAFGWRRVD